MVCHILDGQIDHPAPPHLGYNHCYVRPVIKLHCEFYGNRITFLSKPALRHFFWDNKCSARHLGDIFLATTAGAPPGRHFFDDFAHDAVNNIGTTAVTPITNRRDHNGARPF